MDQRSLLYISLLFVSFLIWQTWEVDQAEKNQESNVSSVSTPNSVDSSLKSEAPDLPNESIVSASTAQSSVPTSIASSLGKEISVKTDVFDIVLSSVGGDIISVKLLDFPVSLKEKDTPVTLLHNEPPRYFSQSGLLHDRINGEDFSHLAPSHYAVFRAESTSFELGEGSDSLEVRLVWDGLDGIKVSKVYTFTRGEYSINVDHIISNSSDSTWIGRQYRQLRHGPTIDSDGSILLYTFTGAAYHTDKYNKLAFEDMVDEPLSLTVPTDAWIAMVEHYFLSAWIPVPAGQPESLYTRVVNTGFGQEHIIGMKGEGISIAPGSSETLRSIFYAGPLDQFVLQDLAEGLELTVDYGIFTVFSKPIFWLMTQIHHFVGNWGWTIILLTLLLKLALYPLSAASYRSMAKMKAAAPKMQNLKERYAEDKQGLQKAMMDMYKKEKINPLGGCLPILVQIPIFIALYWVLLGSVELRQAPWIFWIEDLSIKDPFFVLPLLMGITMFIQQKLNPPPSDPMQAKLMMALPFVFTVFFAFFPSGLVLYWFVNNLLSILQQYKINRELKV